MQSRVKDLAQEFEFNDNDRILKVYGQTGSGKTFTMTSFYEKAVRDIFEKLSEVTERFAENLPTVSVSFYEIAGDACLDLLNGFQVRSLGI
jgi:predicted ATPase